MNKVLFSSWGGNIVDNRGVDPGKYAGIENLGLPLEYNAHQIRAFMSWNGMIVADDKVNIVDMAYSYLKEVQRLSCGECTVGYLGVRIMVNILARVLGGEGMGKDIDLLERLGTNIKENAKCDFCASAITPILDSINYYKGAYTRLISGKEAVSKLPYITRITAPCMEACQAHQDIPGYIELIKNRRFAESLNLIRETNCLPGVTGRACVAFCEASCVRNDTDSPLAIRLLKRFSADYEIANGLEPKFEKKKVDELKVAVIGAGPAGLSAGYNLALMGYKVTIYDEQSSAGGMALVGIPSYRLPRDILEREIDVIKGLGIEVELNTRVGRDIALEELYAQGFKAIFIATGAHLGRQFDIENWRQDCEGLIDGIEFLRDVNLGKKIASKDKVIIVGGGNVAVDCARSCLRLGCKDVAIVYRRSRAEMPGRQEEIEQAEREGAKIYFLAVPVKVLIEGGTVTGAECIRMQLGEPDASGRRRPVPVKGSEFVMEADLIISAIGEAPDLSFLTEDKPICIAEQGTIAVDLYSYQTSTPEVFSGGDCVTGPATLIEAIAAGSRAARSIDQYLKSGKVIPSDEDRAENSLHSIDLSRRDRGVMPRKPRQSPEELAIPDRKLNFNEVEQCLTPEAAVEEAERCLRCYRVMLLAITSEN